MTKLRSRPWKLCIIMAFSGLKHVWTFVGNHRKLVMFTCVVFMMFGVFMAVPVSWRRAPLTHLHLLYVTVQNFDVDKPDCYPMENTSIPVHVTCEETSKYINKTYSVNLNRAKNRTDIDVRFLPSMTALERTNMLVTTNVFIQACNWSNITYFLCGGTLLGSYRHHGFIPWDDDVDIAVNASDWRKLRHVLTHIPGYSLHSPGKMQWKFYPTDVPASTPPVGFNWPNVDIFFFSEDSTYIWGLTNGYLQHFFSRKSEVFPLQLRPFENMMAAVPCNTEVIVQQEFDVDTCATLSYNHKQNAGVGVFSIRRRWCGDLFSAYPFVVRKPEHTGKIIETLKIGKRIIQEFTLPAFCTST